MESKAGFFLWAQVFFSPTQLDATQRRAWRQVSFWEHIEVMEWAHPPLVGGW